MVDPRQKYLLPDGARGKVRGLLESAGGGMNVSTKRPGSPPNSRQDISVWTKVVDQPNTV